MFWYTAGGTGALPVGSGPMVTLGRRVSRPAVGTREARVGAVVVGRGDDVVELVELVELVLVVTRVLEESDDEVTLVEVVLVMTSVLDEDKSDEMVPVEVVLVMTSVLEGGEGVVASMALVLAVTNVLGRIDVAIKLGEPTLLVRSVLEDGADMMASVEPVLVVIIVLGRSGKVVTGVSLLAVPDNAEVALKEGDKVASELVPDCPVVVDLWRGVPEVDVSRVDVPEVDVPGVDAPGVDLVLAPGLALVEVVEDSGTEAALVVAVAGEVGVELGSDDMTGLGL